ncbi:UDP-glucose 4-epimerase GalE [Polynucleobacter brandtiae]|nr:UDP-glucose 4-epimerase GalE [Polynucleobacter brandtiae]
MNILLTGGAGYIGSHTALALLNAGHTPILLDNFSASDPKILTLLKAAAKKDILFYEGNVGNQTLIRQILKEHSVDVVMHFAAFKAVGESVKNPLAYYKNNVSEFVNLLSAMDAEKVRNLIFSSSCTVYGNPVRLPVSEDFSYGFNNPYGHTKVVCEQILESVCVSNKGWKVGKLRYFNPVGSHDSGYFGELPVGLPSNLMPYLDQVASGEVQKLYIFGGDYPTGDGTCIRDYVHISDLSEGHIASLEGLIKVGSHAVNLGTGIGYSVLEVVAEYERVTRKKIPYEIIGRRPGDVPAAFADPSMAFQVLGWKAKRSLGEMCLSSYSWRMQLPTLLSSCNLAPIGISPLE